MVRGDQVAHLPAGVLGRALRMLVLEQAGKDPRLVAAGDRAHLEAGDGIGAVRNAAGGGHRVRKRPGARRRGRAPPRRRKCYASRRLQIAERRPAARLARPAERVIEAEPGADLPGECRPARKAPGRRHGRENRLAVAGQQRAANRCVLRHGA